MYVEVVHYQMDGLGMWILKSQLKDDFGKLKRRTIRSGKSEVATRLGLDRAEHVGRATAFVFVVSSGFPPRNGRRKGRHLGMQRDRFLVQADYRLL